jgi:dienelactone hydrolase
MSRQTQCGSLGSMWHWRRIVSIVAAIAAMVAWTSTAQAEIPQSLKSSCTLKTPAPGYSYQFCDDGVPSAGGTTPNIGGASAVRVPAKYDGWQGLPPKSPDAAGMPGADPDGNIALDVDISMPTLPAPPGGYPVIVLMHGCCFGTKNDWKDTQLDPPGEKWHFNNAWFASRGYIAVTYTARGFRRLVGKEDDQIQAGSTGETQLDSRQFEINDYQYLTGLIADDPFFNANPQKIVATGGSYGGGFAWLALTDPIWTSPGGKEMKLAAVAPRYGWTDIVYSLLPNGTHSQSPDALPAFDGSDTTTPFGIPKTTVNSILYLSGLIGTSFPPYIQDAFTCLGVDDPLPANPACAATIQNTLPSFIQDRSAYYQNDFFDRIATDPSYRIPIFNAGTFTDPLFTSVENLRMSNRLQSVVPDYPIQQYFGDYEHFTQNKAREWGDICGADHHVCTLADYPGGDVNATPPTLVRTGVHTRLNRFIDHYAQPPGDPAQPRPAFDVTASLQICPQNASAAYAENEPGPTFTAGSFADLTQGVLRLDMSGTQTTVNHVEPNPHAAAADPVRNGFLNGGRCPVTSSPAGPDVATYQSGPLERAQTMIGGAIVSIDYSATTAEALQLDSRLYDVFPDGTAVLVDRGPRRLDRASGTVSYQLQGNGWRFEAGHSIRIEIAQDDHPFLKFSTVPSSATLTHVSLRIPTLERQPPVRSDFKNGAKFCQAQREFLGDAAFADAYGTNKGSNAFGKCVSADAHSG